jgi:LPS-assembly protein
MTRRLPLISLVAALFVSCFIFALAPWQTFAAEISYEAEGPVTMEADTLTYNQAGDSISLEGAVRILYKDMTVQADKVIFYDKTKELAAEGRVVLTEGEDILRCDRLELNIETKKGTVYHGKIFLKKKNFHVTGSKIEKLGESEYRVHDATVTTCDAKLPYWMFTVKQLDVDIEGFGQGWWAGFRVLDIPVLYFPWAMFPVKRDRQSGFLFPYFGSSSKWGPEIMVPFYWNIAPNQDATFYVERIGDTRGRGWKEGAEYRYAWSTQAQGQIRGNYLWDERGDKSSWWDERQDKSRWSIFAEHDQRFSGGYYLKTNINWVSDKNYPVDFPSDIPKETRIDATSLNQLESTITAGKNWEWGALETDAYYFRSLFFPTLTTPTSPLNVDDNGATMQMLPQVNISLYQERFLETPIFYEMEAQGTNFWREKLTGPTPAFPTPGLRDVVRGGRIDLYPRVSIPLKPLDIVRFEPWIGYRETIYFDPTEKFDDVTSREIYDAGASLATTISRVFPLQWGKVRGIKHIIEPKVIYTYIPGVNESDNPNFTYGLNSSVMQTDNPYFNHGIDTITRQNTITWMLTNYLIGKEVGKDGEVSYPEYLYLKLYQSYNFSPNLTQDLTPLFPKSNSPFFPVVLPAEQHHLSNLAVEARVAPVTWLSGTMDLQYNPSDNRLDALNAGIKFADTRGDKLGVQYRFTQGLVEEVNAELGIRIINPLDLYFDYRYNLRDNVRIETVYGLDYRHQCWEVSLRVHDINRQPDPTEITGTSSEVKVMVWITLTGLGKYRVQ